MISLEKPSPEDSDDESRAGWRRSTGGFFVGVVLITISATAVFLVGIVLLFIVAGMIVETMFQ